MKETKQASGSPILAGSGAQAVVREMMAAFEAFKGANDVRLGEIEKKAVADVLLEEKVARIDQAVAAGKWDDVKTSTASLNQMCQTCHTAYRERLEDGTSRVRGSR